MLPWLPTSTSKLGLGEIHMNMTLPFKPFKGLGKLSCDLIFICLVLK